LTVYREAAQVVQSDAENADYDDEEGGPVVARRADDAETDGG